MNFTFMCTKEVVVKNRIEEIRKEKGIRQEEFAKSMGVSRQTISSLENGRYNPSIILAYKIAKYFGITTDFLLGVEKSKTIDVSGLTDGQISAVRAVIDEFNKN